MDNTGFSLIELVVVMAIFSILAGLGFSGYMDSMRVQRRQDAVLSLQKVNMLISNLLNINPSGITNTCAASNSCIIGTTSVCRINNNSISFPCISDNSFYCISYCPNSASNYFNSGISGLTDISDRTYLTANENFILQATAIIGKGQDKDIPTKCQNIYISDQNNVYPTSCIQ